VEVFQFSVAGAPGSADTADYRRLLGEPDDLSWGPEYSAWSFEA
jgi:hypothetical protein